jgi:hypothetical protein
MRREEQNFAFKLDTYGEKGWEEFAYLKTRLHDLLLSIVTARLEPMW